MLSPAQKILRDGKITASFVPQLISGNSAAILSKWKELVGDPTWEPEDFSKSWPMALGSHVEGLALDWREQKTKSEISRRGEVVFHPTRPHVAATLDGYRASDRAVLDAKWIDSRLGLDDRLAYYTPQLVVQRACVPEAEFAALVVVHGGAEPQELFANITPDYEESIWLRIDQFWACVENLTPPVPLPPLPPPPERWTKIDLDDPATENLNWRATMQWNLAQWRETRAAAELHAAASADVKKLLPDDCGELISGGTIVKRNRARAVSIKVLT
jgi:hypothetical protein